VTTVDYMLLLVIALSAVVGVVRGLVKEALSLVVWAAALWVASRYGMQAGRVLQDYIASEELRDWAGRLLLFVAVIFVGAILTWLIGMLIRSSALSIADRLLGLAFGVGRGVLVVGLVIIALQLGGFSSESWWRQAKLIPYAARVGQVIRQAVGRDLLAVRFPPGPSNSPGWSPPAV
jgi:membrane protein required for colicin V production